jgi:glycogen operon protein
MLLNAHHEPVPFILPAHRARLRWELMLDTRDWQPPARRAAFRAGDQYPLEGRSLAILKVAGDRRSG